MEYLDLKFINGEHLKINNERLQKTKDELEDFLRKNLDINNKHYAAKVMFSYELKTNNQIEGYSDDVDTIESILKGDEIITMREKRIINLHKGYNYILEERDINKDNLKCLYNILSNHLLGEYDLTHMGKYYREAPVYIYYSANLSVLPDEGIPYEKIDEFMNSYFNFLNSNIYSDTLTDEYIKSQILHFYFVYIHPFFDVNGRTARTTSMWYLLLKKCYPYIIFNRGITLHGSDYSKVILEAKKYKNISYFIFYMLKTVQAELEKEYIMNQIINNSHTNINSKEHQTLLYFLSMNGNLTVKDFATTYNRLHDVKKTKEIYETMLIPLIDKHILEVERCTNKCMFDNFPNELLRINPKVLDYDKSQIRVLKKYK